MGFGKRVQNLLPFLKPHFLFKHCLPDYYKFLTCGQCSNAHLQHFEIESLID